MSPSVSGATTIPSVARVEPSACRTRDGPPRGSVKQAGPSCEARAEWTKQCVAPESSKHLTRRLLGPVPSQP